MKTAARGARRPRPTRLALIADDGDAVAPLRALLRESVTGTVAAFAHLRTDAAVAEIKAGSWRFDLAVFNQSRPGAIDRRTVDLLIGNTPLTRWVVRLGPFCVSERRRDAGAWPEGAVVTDDDLALAVTNRIAAASGHAVAPPRTAKRVDIEMAATSFEHRG